MLVTVLKFEIADFKNKSVETYLIPNTSYNQELVLCHRYTRHIEFVEMFDFQFSKEERFPAELMTVSAGEIENEICWIDEMVGMVL